MLILTGISVIWAGVILSLLFDGELFMNIICFYFFDLLIFVFRSRCV